MGNIGQDHSVTLDQGHCASIFQIFFLSETTGLIKVKFNMESLLEINEILHILI